MTAPALVMVTHGSADPRVATATYALRSGLHQMRPDLTIHAGFLGTGAPGIDQVVRNLAESGVREVVLVPLELTHAIEPAAAIEAAACRARAELPALSCLVSRPVGPEASLLTILDRRLRSALAAARVLELDGLVLSSASSGDVRGSALLARRARQWSTHHRLPCLTAVADGSGPTVAQAVKGLRAQGRRHIAVGSFFLHADALFATQAELAHRCGAVAVSDPIGPSREVLDLVLARYAFAAMDLLDQADASSAVVAGAFDHVLGA